MQVLGISADSGTVAMETSVSCWYAKGREGGKPEIATTHELKPAKQTTEGRVRRSSTGPCINGINVSDASPLCATARGRVGEGFFFCPRVVGPMI